jgi:hypothetical protein
MRRSRPEFGLPRCEKGKGSVFLTFLSSLDIHLPIPRQNKKKLVRMYISSAAIRVFVSPDYR